MSRPQKISKETSELNCTTNHMNLVTAKEHSTNGCASQQATAKIV
jgi:hypothetical protein